MTQEYKMEYKPTFKDKLTSICKSDTNFIEYCIERKIIEIVNNSIEDINYAINRLSASEKKSIEVIVGWRHLFGDEKSYIDFCNLTLTEALAKTPKNIKVYFSNHETITFEKLDDTN